MHFFCEPIHTIPEKTVGNALKVIVNLLSCVKKGIIFLHEKSHHTILYMKNYFFLDI